MNDPRLRHDWIKRVPGLELKSTLNNDGEHYDPGQQHLVTYEPGDKTNYTMSLSPASWVHLRTQMGYPPELDYWQVSVWSGTGMGPGTMIVESTGTHGLCIEDFDRIHEMLRCTEYAARVFSILIHGCLVSHDLSVAQEGIARFRNESRLGFVDPDAT